jgi:hypothetical protein
MVKELEVADKKKALLRYFELFESVGDLII